MPQNLFFNVRRFVRQIGGLSSLFVRLVEIHYVLGPLVPRIPHVVHSQVGRNPVKPSRELCACLVARTRPIYAQKDFLRQIFRRALIMGHAVHKVDDRTTIFLY